MVSIFHFKHTKQILSDPNLQNTTARMKILRISKVPKGNKAKENLETTWMISTIEEEQRKSLKDENSNVTDVTRLI